MINSYFNVLVDDSINIKEHGLSIYIKVGDYQLLFDTGQTDCYLVELKKIGLDKSDLDAVIISHGHYDHINGLLYLDIEKPVYLHQDAIKPKYKKEGIKYRYNGVNEAILKFHKDNFIFVDYFHEIFENIYVLGRIETKKYNPNFTLEKNKNIIDDFHDEIILIINQDDGLSIFMGCSHFGATNGLLAVKRKFPDKHIKNVIAGMHLKESDEKTISKIINDFHELEIEYVYPLHCTGALATNLFKSSFKERCIVINSSNKIKL
jgi:7,8-dihydropterin-6-yl-methyl-4-(beta-D-ribofuranosyl)aminobenzene 5'-phosphate synthase